MTARAPRQAIRPAMTAAATPTPIRPRSRTFAPRSSRTERGPTIPATARCGCRRRRSSAPTSRRTSAAGHWAYDSDYTWVSDYDWGWAPFHYGRWVYAAGPGWEWIPGREYAGAWVSWRYGVDDWAYVGWAPLAPTWCWRGGVAVGLGFVPRAPYAFVGTGELFAPRVGTRVVAGPQVGVIASHTRPYAPASSPGGARVAAHPSVGGPSPAALHISPDVGHARRARQPRPDAGARVLAPRDGGGPRRTGSGRVSSPRGRRRAASREAGAAAYAYRSQAMPSSSHFGGRRLGGGFAGNAAASAPMRSPVSARGRRPSSVLRTALVVGGLPWPLGDVRSYSAPSAMRAGPPQGAFRSGPPAGAPFGGASIRRRLAASFQRRRGAWRRLPRRRRGPLQRSSLTSWHRAGEAGVIAGASEVFLGLTLGKEDEDGG